MIKIERVSPPLELTQKYIDEKTKLFKDEKKNVWNKAFIKEALLKMSNNKCA